MTPSFHAGRWLCGVPDMWGSPEKVAIAGRGGSTYVLFISIAELRKLPPVEKLKIIEALRGDLAGDEDAF